MKAVVSHPARHPSLREESLTPHARVRFNSNYHFVLARALASCLFVGVFSALMFYVAHEWIALSHSQSSRVVIAAWTSGAVAMAVYGSLSSMRAEAQARALRRKRKELDARL